MTKLDVYIIHGKDKADCRRIAKDKGLPLNRCVFVLKDYPSPAAKDTEEFKHIWSETK